MMIFLLFSFGFQLPNSQSNKNTKSNILNSGKCGDNLFWVLSKSNTELTISGEGKMTNYQSKDHTPWITYARTITTVKVLDSAKSIGDWAFAYLPNLNKVSISNQVESIGAHSFSFCPNLATISLPQNVKAISMSSFEKCTKLSTITLGSSATTIDECAFSCCSSLRKIVIPNPVVKIDMYAFYCCNSLTEITFGTSLKTIGAFGFFNCTSLQSIAFPTSLQTIGDFSFRYCSKITSINIPANVDYIGKSAFWHMDSVKSFSVDSSNQNFKSIDGVLFTANGSTLIQYPNGKDSTSYTSPKEVRILEEGAFLTTKLHTIKISEGCEIVQNFVFADSQIQKIDLPSTITQLGSKSFSSCTNLNTMNFYGKKAPQFGVDVFKNCTNLKKICVSPDYTDTTFLDFEISDIQSDESQSKGPSKAGISCAVIFTLIGVALIVGIVIYFVKRNGWSFLKRSESDQSLL